MVMDACDSNFTNMDSLSQEDCKYLLRVLEKQAFEYVVFALRAQGPLTQYKEIVLDHLKSLLFIAEEDFYLQIRLAANNPYLSRIAQELNPSYDTFSKWLTTGYNPAGANLARSKAAKPSTSFEEDQQASHILLEMNKHNRNLQDENEALFKILRVPKKPYVPEKLRRLLQDSEADTNGRIDIIKEKEMAEREKQREIESKRTGRLKRNQANEPKPSTSTRTLRQKRRRSPEIQEQISFIEKSAVSPSTVALEAEEQMNLAENLMELNGIAPLDSSSTVIADSIELAAEESVFTDSPSVSNHHLQESIVSDTAIESAPQDNFPDFTLRYGGADNVVVLEPEDNTFVFDSKSRKKQRKPDDGTLMCARARPFVFERSVTYRKNKTFYGKRVERCPANAPITRVSSRRSTSQLGFSVYENSGHRNVSVLGSEHNNQHQTRYATSVRPTPNPVAYESPSKRNRTISASDAEVAAIHNSQNPSAIPIMVTLCSNGAPICPVDTNSMAFFHLGQQTKFSNSAQFSIANSKGKRVSQTPPIAMNGTVDAAIATSDFAMNAVKQSAGVMNGVDKSAPTVTSQIPTCSFSATSNGPIASSLTEEETFLQKILVTNGSGDEDLTTATSGLDFLASTASLLAPIQTDKRRSSSGQKDLAQPSS